MEFTANKVGLILLFMNILRALCNAFVQAVSFQNEFSPYMYETSFTRKRLCGSGISGELLLMYQ